VQLLGETDIQASYIDLNKYIFSFSKFNISNTKIVTKAFSIVPTILPSNWYRVNLLAGDR
jgi:hypothetical protein